MFEGRRQGIDPGPGPEPPDSDYRASARVATTGQATVASDVYRFGPDGFTFAEMVEAAVPVTGDMTGKDVMLYRIDPTSGASEPCGGTHDSEAKTITAQTYHFSQWYAGGRPAANTAYGAFHVGDLSTTHWLHICVVGYELKYPHVDSNFDGNASCSWAPAGAYRVRVDLYRDCGTGISSMAFDVRVVSGSLAKTYNGTVTSSNGTVGVTTFTVSSGQDFAGQAMSAGSVETLLIPGEYSGLPAEKPANMPEKSW